MKGEMKNLRKDGSSYWVDAVISPRYAESGIIIGYTAVHQDIAIKMLKSYAFRDTFNRLITV